MSQLCPVCVLERVQLLEGAANLIQTAAFFRIENCGPRGLISRLLCTKPHFRN